MPDLEDEERCIAITGSGDRCSRVAKDGRFYFQHDKSYETVEIQTVESAGIVNWLSSELESRATQASDIQRDVYMFSRRSCSFELYSEGDEEVFHPSVDSRNPTPLAICASGIPLTAHLF